ncbi:hypothetical protein AJ79_00119 [Helicocarpus griseus UAMH5409]|uniref:Uncharacterized protein n=1 Tax=Helicocarpus griseus UAMH5409 TaxID=1447875 RepID=A0A2B7YCU0_9EURO|nr:hypothetical protein AJ79_00119 [Helicocarpus griseus UAMH5409]
MLLGSGNQQSMDNTCQKRNGNIICTVDATSRRKLRLAPEWLDSSLSKVFSCIRYSTSYCISEGMEEELVLGYVAVMMLTSRNVRPLKLVPPAQISRPITMPGKNNSVLRKLFGRLDQCMALRATQYSLDSLLCSALFDPSVPCNLTGAASNGIRKALLEDKSNGFDALLRGISHRKAHLSVLWHASVYTGQALPFLSMSLKDLPPICLVAAFWTNTAQSFLHIKYEDIINTSINPATEFTVSYFCRPETRVPWTPAAPFGLTRVENLSLEVKAHYQNLHYPLPWKAEWKLTSGDRISADSRHEVPIIYGNKLGTNSNRNAGDEQNVADSQSRSATSRFFNWHQYNEDGLWLDDGTRTSEDIRQLQRHPWIVDPFDDGDNSESVNETQCLELNMDGILQWRNNVLESG